MAFSESTFWPLGLFVNRHSCTSDQVVFLFSIDLCECYLTSQNLTPMHLLEPSEQELIPRTKNVDPLIVAYEPRSLLCKLVPEPRA